MSMGDIITSAGWSSFIRSSHIVVVDLESVITMRFSTAAALLLSTSAVYGFVPASQPSVSSLLAATETATEKKVRHNNAHTNSFRSWRPSIPRLCSHDYYTLCCTNRSSSCDLD
jgi:hypothetical protein